MPGRVLRRIAFLVALLVVVGLAASLAFAIYGEWRLERALERFEAVLGPAELSRFARPEIAAADNAATWLLAGAGAVVLSEDWPDFRVQRTLAGRSWSTEESARMTRVVELNASALELLRRAASCAASSYSLDYESGPDAELPDRLIELLRAGGLVWVDGRLALAADDVPRLRADLETLDRLAGSLASESLLVTALIAFAVDRYYLDLVHRLVTGGSEDESLLADIEASLVARDRQATYLRALAAEGSMIRTLSAESMFQAHRRGPLGWLRLQLSRPVERLLMAEMLDELSTVGELLREPWPQVVAASEERAERGFPGPLAAMLYPNLIDSMGKLKAWQSATQLAIEAIRNRRAQLTGGAPSPARAAKLVDPYTGGEVVVEHRPDGRLVLEAPGALELWRASHSVQSRLGDPHFTWEVPAKP